MNADATFLQMSLHTQGHNHVFQLNMTEERLSIHPEDNKRVSNITIIHISESLIFTNPDIFETTYLFIWICVDGFINHSGEQFKKDAISVSRFTSFVWTKS